MINDTKQENVEDRLPQTVEEWETYLKDKFSMKWISVKDQLPPHGKRVLATYKDRGERDQIIVGFHYERFKEESFSDESYDEYHEETGQYYYCEGWYEQQLNWGEFASIYVNEGEVTH